MKYHQFPYRIFRKWFTSSVTRKINYQLAAVILFTLLCYARVVFYDFVYYDDDVMLINNDFVKHLNLQTLISSFRFDNIVHYHPLVYLSFSVEYFLFGLNPAFYHLTNILLHVANVYLLFLILKRIGIKNQLNILTVLFFAFHPLHVESVAWVTERKDLLYTMFYFGSLLLYDSYRRIGKNKYYFSSLILFVLSCLSKSMAVTLPFVLILIGYYLKKDDWNNFKKYLPFLMISLVFSFINLKVAYFNSNLGNFNFVEVSVLACYALLFYPYKIIFPLHLSAIYPYPESLNWFHYTCAIVFILAIVIFFVLNKNRLIVFGVLFYLITILPVLPIIPFGISLTADRYVYIPSIGLFLTISVLIYRTYLTVASKMPYARKVFITLSSVIFISIALMSFARCAPWKNTETLMRDALSYDSKNYFGYFILGNYYNSAKSYRNAVSNYEECIRIKPGYSDAILNLGNSYFNLSDLENAKKCFNRVIEIDPEDREAYNNLGVVYESKGELEEAIKNYKIAALLGYIPAIEVVKYYGDKK